MKLRSCLFPIFIIFIVISAMFWFDNDFDDKEPVVSDGTTEWQDQVYLLGDDYFRRIFGKYRFARTSTVYQSIYYEVYDESLPEQISLAEGTIEKYAHDGERYIAYHITNEDGSESYALLDTKTEETEFFESITVLSDTVRERNIKLGCWFYTYAQNSYEGVLTPLFGEYSIEYISSLHGRSVMFRDIPLFHGVLDDIQTDKKRYIAFRQRIIADDMNPWFSDPITNSLLSPLSEKSLGLYKKHFPFFYKVFYDKYVLFDTALDSVKEFDKEKQLAAYCTENKISLQNFE